MRGSVTDSAVNNEIDAATNGRTDSTAQRTVRQHGFHTLTKTCQNTPKKKQKQHSIIQWTLISQRHTHAHHAHHTGSDTRGEKHTQLCYLEEKVSALKVFIAMKMAQQFNLGHISLLLVVGDAPGLVGPGGAARRRCVLVRRAPRTGVGVGLSVL